MRLAHDMAPFMRGSPCCVLPHIVASDFFFPGGMMDITRIIQEIAAEMRAAPERGAVCSYIPPLAAVDPHKFGIAVLEADGTMHVAGEAEESFSIQSISKVFALTLAMELAGEVLWERVRQEPSGNAFNSIVQLESENGIPRNPFINAGALVVTDTLLSQFGKGAARRRFLGFMRSLVTDGSEPRVDEALAREEYESGFRNQALANYMRNFGTISHQVPDVLRQYYAQCAIGLSCRQLAETGRFLMEGGRAAREGQIGISARTARVVSALMMLCGHYDGSGAFAARVGLPGKSGVSGTILAVAPGVASIAVWSPGLNAQGNSLLGTEALERLVERTGWSVFGVPSVTAPIRLPAVRRESAQPHRNRPLETALDQAA
ncbi:glutaminase, partial [Acidomonas methanolica]